MSALPESEVEPRARGPFALLIDVFLSPAEAFREIARRPRFWAPLIAFTLLQGAFAAVWLDRVDIVEFARAQAVAAGRQPPPAGPGSESAYDFVRTSIGVSMLAFTPLVALAMAGVLMFVFNFMLGGESEYRQCLAVVGWTSLVVGLVSVPLTLVVMVLKGDWNIDPQSALSTHPAAFLDPRHVPRALFSLAQSLDLLSFWTIFLLSKGMAQVARRSTAASVAAVGALWLAYVVIKVAFSALF